MKLFVVFLMVFVLTYSLPHKKLSQHGQANFGDQEKARIKRNINLPVLAGNSLDLVKKLWDTVATGALNSKLELSIKNYSKWMISHVSSEVKEGSIGMIPNLIAPGVQESFVAWQPTIFTSTKGTTNWRITVNKTKYPAAPEVMCAIDWNVPVGGAFRSSNYLAINCMTSNPNTEDPEHSYAHGSIKSIFSCYKDLFCLRGIMPSHNQPTAYVSLFPRQSDDWAAVMDQNYIDSLFIRDSERSQQEDKTVTSPILTWYIIGIVFGTLAVIFSVFCTCYWDRMKNYCNNQYKYFLCCCCPSRLVVVDSTCFFKTKRFEVKLMEQNGTEVQDHTENQMIESKVLLKELKAACKKTFDTDGKVVDSEGLRIYEEVVESREVKFVKCAGKECGDVSCTCDKRIYTVRVVTEVGKKKKGSKDCQLKSGLTDHGLSLACKKVVKVNGKIVKNVVEGKCWSWCWWKESLIEFKECKGQDCGAEECTCKEEVCC